MSDTPIFDDLNNPDEHEENVPKRSEARAWILTEPGRKWLYTIAAAVLVVVAGYFSIDAATQEAWLSLVAAVLNIGGAGALTYARVKVDR